MKKKVFIVVISLFLCSCIYIGAEINKNNSLTNNNTKYKIVKNEKCVYCKTKELEKTSDKAVEKLKNGDYPNLTTKGVEAIVNNNDSISRINIKQHEYRQYEKKQIEALNEQMRILEYYLGTNIYNSYLHDNSTMKNYDEVKRLILSGKYEVKDRINIPYMVYNASDTEYKYGMISCSLDYMWIDKGKIYAMEKNPKSYDPFWASEIVKQYSITDNNLDDEYQLNNGKMTVREGIEFIQDYMDNKLIFDTNPDTNMLVDRVTVVKVTDSIYAFCFRMRREYAGIVFESGERVGEDDQIYAKDHMYTYMIDTNDVDIFYGTGDRYDIKKTNINLKESVSLESALQLISAQIGSNSSYDVESIELIYRQKYINTCGSDYKTLEELEGIPFWRICGKNSNDKEKTYFYIDIANGELSYVVGEKY